MSQPARRIIIVSWHFPPSEEIGGKIVWRLAKQLAMLGCDVRVLAPPATEASQRDDAYATAQPPGLRVIRTAIRRNLTKVAARFWSRVTASPTHSSTTTQASMAMPSSMPVHPLRRLARSLLVFSDHRNRWIAPAAKQLRQMLADEPADLVLSVSPAFPAHLAVLRTRPAMQNTPWFAWFHDPGAHFLLARGDDIASYRGTALWAARLLARQEKRVIEHASRLLVTTQQLADEYAQLLPRLRTPLVLPCGFDAGEFPAAEPRPRRAKLVIAHVGTIYMKRTPRPVIESLARLKAAGIFRSGEVEMRFVGRLENAEGEQLLSLIEQLNMGDVVAYAPQVSQADALNIIQDADVGLVLAEQQPTQVPAKIFEYIGLRRPIMALSDGATRDLVAQCHIGYACDRQGLDGTLAELISQWREDGLAKFQKALDKAAARYDMSVIAKALLAELESPVPDDASSTNTEEWL